MSADLIYCFQNTQWINFPVEPGCYPGLLKKAVALWVSSSGGERSEQGPRRQVRLVLLNLFPSLAGS